jgi:hypothetical protein|uniref:Uncharacterized protein n=1 Tax=Podoviridae sp. ctXdu7 TaxID=2827618 RepID=A0A8S5RRV2_9CAUD|nr:MAG TPA: hypothetical protein [Podoviridae sp. ctXdu7]
MKPQEIIDKTIIARALRLEESKVCDIGTGCSKYIIRIYKNTQHKFILSLVNFENKKKKVIGYYLSEQVDKELPVDYPKPKYSIYMYEDIQKMIKESELSSKDKKPIKYLVEDEPKKEDNSKLIQSLKRELNIIELKIQKEELLKRIEDAS